MARTWSKESKDRLLSFCRDPFASSPSTVRARIAFALGRYDDLAKLQAEASRMVDEAQRDIGEFYIDIYDEGRPFDIGRLDAMYAELSSLMMFDLVVNGYSAGNEEKSDVEAF